jgi:hypothetical protein
VTLPDKSPPQCNLWAEGRNAGIAQCAAALRADGVDIDARSP